MKKLFIAGNWKSNKTLSEAEDWIGKFNTVWENVTIVVCMPYTLLGVMKSKNLSFLCGAQDVSPFGDGAYTGEVSARQIKECTDWVIIGHSERRKYFSETDDMLQKKVEQAKSVGLKIIYCVSDDITIVPQGVDVVAYEPVWAIGTGKTDTPENANAVIVNIKTKYKIATVIYGGSVTSENVASFVSQPAIDGVLPGGASLEAEKFIQLISYASHD